MLFDYCPGLSLGTTRLKHIILAGHSYIYAIAFASLYWQIPGLYGEHGLLPVASRLRCADEKSLLSCNAIILQAVIRQFDLRPSVALQVVALLGLALAVVTAIFKSLRNFITYGLLFFLYLSAFEVGQIFLWFQWDTLLLESGALAAILAAFGDTPVDSLSLFLFRWLATRLMFASGVVKLQSQCPTWWNLTALDIHYQSQCIPTPLAWFAHHAPSWFRRLSVALTFYIEIFLPPLFTLPIASLRRFAGVPQIFFMVLIMLTGNYNFFNLHYALICFSLFETTLEEHAFKEKRWLRALRWLLSTAVAVGTIVLFLWYFPAKVNFKDYTLDTKVGFTRAQFDKFVKIGTSATLHLGIIAFTFTTLYAIYGVFKSPKRVSAIFNFAFVLVLGGSLFWISMVPFTTIDASAAARVPDQLKKLHALSDKLQLTHSYGLFRRMTGVEGRPEIVIEGALQPQGPWTEFQFYSKPGNLSARPIFVLPHQPRLDWQMWFAALGAYQHNPFYLSLVHHLFQNTSVVTQLMGDYPFKDKENPVQFIRAQLYLYYFTDPGDKAGNWWRRVLTSEYQPVLSRDAPPVVEFLENQGLLLKKKYKDNELGRKISGLHKIVRTYDQTNFVWSIIVAIFVLQVTKWNTFDRLFGGSRPKPIAPPAASQKKSEKKHDKKKHK